MFCYPNRNPDGVCTMPTYSYECGDCGHTFDARQRMTDDPLSTCPECEGSVERIISGGLGIVFKGAGFHANDSCRNGGSCSGGSCSTCSDSCSH